MIIQIKAIGTSGFTVTLEEKPQGRKVAFARGYVCYFVGDKPKGYTLNTVVNIALPNIASIAKCNASDVQYSRLNPLPRTKKISKSQLELL